MTTAAEKLVEKVESDKTPSAAVSEKAVPAPRKALGRGLDSLLPGGPRVVAPAAAPSIVDAGRGIEIQAVRDSPAERAAAGNAVLQISLDAIEKNPYQTRYFTKEEQNEDGDGETTLQELAESIRAQGVIQPITVRPGKDGRYVLITGERRWRASKLAGKEKIPAIVRQVSDQQAAEMTIIENLQREDLNCLDQARAFVMLSQKFNLTQEQIGERVGVARQTVSNYMRLVRLPESVLKHLESGALDYSHARMLVNVSDPATAARAADLSVQKFLSVEQLEDLLMRLQGLLAMKDGPKGGGARWVDPNVRAAQRELERVLGVRVRIRDRNGKGKITIEYATLEDFDRVIGMLRGKNST